MKIKTVKIKNFKCLGVKELQLDFSEDIIILVGENNVGKSSILKALDLFFSGKKASLDHFCNYVSDEDHSIEISVLFNELTDKDKEHPAVAEYFQEIGGEEVWGVKKVFYFQEGVPKANYTSLPSNRGVTGLTTTVDNLFVEPNMQKIIVEAIKDVKEESVAGAKSAFGQIYNLLIKTSVEETEEYRNIHDALIKYEQLFTSDQPLEKIQEVQDTLDERLRRIIEVSSKIKLSMQDYREKVMPVPTLLTNDRREIDIPPEHQGNGLQRVLIFSLLEILAENTSSPEKELGPRNLLLVEEPEIYMHPQMERKIADTLYEIAKGEKAQVICTTHSPIFIRIHEKQKALVRLVRDPSNNLDVIQQKEDIFSGPTREDEKSKLRMVTTFDPTVNEIFFAKRVVLVEGDTEIAAFKESASLLELFNNPEHLYKKTNTTLINCRGKWTIPAFQQVLNHFSIDYVVVHDMDEEGETGANVRILQLLNGDESKRLVMDRKIEDVLGGDIKVTRADKPIKAVKRVQELNISGELEKVFGAYTRFVYDIPLSS